MSCKLRKPKDDCANLEVPLGISRNIRIFSQVFSLLQRGFRGKPYQSNSLSEWGKESLFFYDEEIITDLEIFLLS